MFHHDSACKSKVGSGAKFADCFFFVRQLGQLVCGQKVDLITFRFGDEVPLSRCQLIELLVRDKKDRKKMCHFASAGHYGN